MEMTKQSTYVELVEDGSILTPEGFKATGIHAGLKKKRKDLGVILCEVPANVAAVYTLNQIQAAPLKVTQESIAVDHKIQALVVNSANANACTGERGLQDAYTMRQASAEQFGLDPHLVAVTSTGVIGEYLAIDKVKAGITLLNPNNEAGAAVDFNEAILTTDTTTKQTCFQTTVDGKTVSVGGVAKGSGMIHPNMATMLSFVTTDAVIESDVLQKALSSITNQTFNRITVDGDTSTNDMAVVMASGLAGNQTLSPEHPDWEAFYEALKLACESLSKQIARDGEGATKLIEVQVVGALNDEEAGKVAKQIVGSDLVKSAIYGKDANWGRIICAIGYSECTLDPDSIDIAIGDLLTLKNSQPVEFSEEQATAYMTNKDTIIIHVNLNIAHGEGKAWGCDLTYDYVRINAGYRT
ncbi:bifunctional glutamate N-acetyltransferase/amino-acid acetyltransferase ArgJ [Alkalicoccobacillus porphyridii]|uniref:Arginine biosynthesis bifunctional protein ArgJ n=1 Tax=Alkalicoccobacillus porphyridii TaxID=2597270 RepID=A0A553ZXG9_9BACI|nr:bifunctional glutamate N-acetyltransferase/amino-acid acetyltransferase ArgJ [Alkalicoccobacillus porphyridii]TSB46149.1 bifunctional glutamate N-acetyltransferase/amino-acid acetyltransferase ArgJ [Alkalicoccobacillus porphyridii]